MSLPYTKLNPNPQTKKGPGKARFAPHKPLLLLSIIDLAEAGFAETGHVDPFLAQDAAGHVRICWISSR